jgi:hypothetical protein
MKTSRHNQCFSLCFMIGAVALLGCAAPVRATIYLSDAGWSQSVGSWDLGTMTGTLTQDVTEGIDITSDRITLDGAGHSVTGSGAGSGVYAEVGSLLTIKNLEVRQFDVGIHVSGYSQCTVSGNSVHDNNRGIYLYGTFTGSGNNTISNNTAFGNAEGIYVYLEPIPLDFVLRIDLLRHEICRRR